MADTSNLTKYLEDIASAIKTKTNKEQTEKIPAADFDTEILSITTGKLTEEEYRQCNDLADAIAGLNDLPYIPLEYIQSTGTQWIMIDIVPTNHTVKMKYQMLSNSNSLNDIIANNFGKYQLTWYNGKYYYALGNTGEKQVNAPSPNYEQTLLFYNQNNKMLMNGIEMGEGASITNATNKLIFFSRGNVITPFKLWYLQVIDRLDNNIIVNLIPVKRKSDNKVMLYDKITNQFHSLYGTGDLVAGPEITGGEV